MTATTIYCIIVRLYIIAIAADSQHRLTTTIAYILTPTQLADRLQKTDCATIIARQQPRDTAVLSIYSRPMATATNRNSGVAVKDKYNV